jgi:hypothetical protein
MSSVPAMYLGKIVSKDNFRVFIYAPDGSMKLVNTWDDFDRLMGSGLWFATSEDAKSSLVVPENDVIEELVKKSGEIKDSTVDKIKIRSTRPRKSGSELASKVRK